MAVLLPLLEAVGPLVEQTSPVPPDTVGVDGPSLSLLLELLLQQSLLLPLSEYMPSSLSLLLSESISDGYSSSLASSLKLSVYQASSPDWVVSTLEPGDESITTSSEES